MILYENIQQNNQILTAIECDICHKIYNGNLIFEIQEFHHIKFQAGFASVFGDGLIVSCDICQHCLKKLIGNYCRIEENPNEI